MRSLLPVLGARPGAYSASDQGRLRCRFLMRVLTIRAWRHAQDVSRPINMADTMLEPDRNEGAHGTVDERGDEVPVLGVGERPRRDRGVASRSSQSGAVPAAVKILKRRNRPTRLSLG
jgi:hypothetical protein